MIVFHSIDVRNESDDDVSIIESVPKLVVDPDQQKCAPMMVDHQEDVPMINPNPGKDKFLVKSAIDAIAAAYDTEFEDEEDHQECLISCPKDKFQRSKVAANKAKISSPIPTTAGTVISTTEETPTSIIFQKTFSLSSYLPHST